MITVLHECDQVSVPGWVVDLQSFRRWADGDDFPEKTRIWYLKGEVWIDLSHEEIFSHVALKGQFFVVLGGLVKTGCQGLFLCDGLFFSNVEADIAGKPDATFISNDTLRSERIHWIANKGQEIDELQGSPDMVLEVVSNSSVHKDTVILRQAYWEAGVREYWLVDTRRDPLTFDILRRTAKGYAATRKQDGWLKSAVFGKSFRLLQQLDARRHPEFTLETR